MKSKIKTLKQASPKILLFFLIILVFIIPTTISWAFIYVETGRFVGPYPGLIITSSIILCILICPYDIIRRTSFKFKKNVTRRLLVISFVIPLLTMFLLSLFFMRQVSYAGQKIDTFIAENKNLDFHDYVTSVSSFLDNTVQKAYKKPEALFRIDNCLYFTSVGAYIMQCMGIDRAEIIVYQGWGTCEQAAILIEELLHGAGYETRQAFFKGIDHQWAEVKHNGTWLIIDPWYIGNFVEVHNLKNIRPEFQNATGVIVQYKNGTLIDASQEHGYLP